MLNRRWLGRRKSEEDADGAVRTGKIELTTQPVLRDHRPGGRTFAHFTFELLDLGAPLCNRRVNKQVHGGDLLCFRIVLGFPQAENVVAHLSWLISRTELRRTGPASTSSRGGQAKR